jgi:hypothetical protein
MPSRQPTTWVNGVLATTARSKKGSYRFRQQLNSWLLRPIVEPVESLPNVLSPISPERTVSNAKPTRGYPGIAHLAPGEMNPLS